MLRRSVRFALVLTAAGLMAVTVAPAVAHQVGRATRPTITTALEERQIVQQTLLIGISSNVLQSQFQLDFYLSPGEQGQCQPLQGGGSDEVRSASTKGQVTTGVNVLYYDTKCTKRYMVQTATYTAGTGSDPVNKLAASNAYYGLTGKKLGVMSTKETAQGKGDSTELLNGLGTFHVTGVSRPVSLGLGCTLNEGSSSVKGACQGGVAQDFAAQHYSLGTVVPVALTAAPSGLTFAATSATRRAGALHALTIVKGAPQKLTLAGAGSSAGSDSMSGYAGSFSLFPPAPTGWTVIDKQHHLTAKLTVDRGSVRNLTGTIRSTTTKKTLATITLDQSGTGRLRYVHGATAPITSWILTR